MKLVITVFFIIYVVPAWAVTGAKNGCVAEFEQCSLDCNPLKTWIFSTEEFRQCMGNCKTKYQKNCTVLGGDKTNTSDKGDSDGKTSVNQDTQRECVKSTKAAKKEHPQGKQYGYEKNPNCGKAKGLNKEGSSMGDSGDAKGKGNKKEKHNSKDKN